MPSISGLSAQILPGAPLWLEQEPDPCAIVIFGITGDLARRKLVPALCALAQDRRLPERLAIIGVGSRAASLDTLREELRQGLAELARPDLTGESREVLLARIDYVRGSVGDAETFARLAAALQRADLERHTEGNRLFYLATPADEFAPIARQLAEHRLLFRAPRAPREWPRLVVEKPFGRDLASARALNGVLAATLDESQVFRIDHYLGKETVQNLLVFRFGNAIFEPLWNQKYVDHVQITASETVGVERRGRFYDATGALRDMVQSHLLQVLALCALEPPLSFRADDLRDESVRLLRSVRPLVGDDVAAQVVRAQYRGYLAEKDVRPDSRTPTYVALKLFIDNWRWHGVPFYLRTGKRLARRVTEVTVHFRPIPFCVFGREEVCQRIDPNILVIRIQPDEGISLRFCTKVPGQDLAVGNVTMDFAYARAFGRPVQEAYERLLLDALRGDASLFWRQDAIEEAWALTTPILEVWERAGGAPLPLYEPGSAGPEAARELLRRDQRAWRELA